MEKQPNPETVISAQRASVEEVVDRIDRIHGPYWKVRSEFVKLLITINTALLAGTVTFSSSLIGDSCAVKFLGLLYLSWGLLFLSLVSSVVAIWLSSQLYTFYPRYFNQTDKLEGEIKALNKNDTEYMDKIFALFKESIDDSVGPLGPADSRTEAATKWSLCAFVVGLGFFLLFGMFQIG